MEKRNNSKAFDAIGTIWEPYMHIRCQDLAASLQMVGRTNTFKRHRLNDNINEFITLALRKGRLIFTFSNLAVTFSRRRKKQSCKSCPVLHTVTGSFWRQWATRLFNQSPVLLWSAKVAANILCRDWALLALAHPALVLFLLWEAVPKDLEGLPYGFLAHFSHQKKTNTNHFRTPACCACSDFNGILVGATLQRVKVSSR